MKTTTTEPVIRRAGERGYAGHGRLKSNHTFSVADDYDPAHLGFRTLQVINDDRVARGGGFGTHPHRDLHRTRNTRQGGALGTPRPAQPPR